MSPLSAEYLSEAGRQIGFQSAFLGGVSATIFAQLLTLHTPRKVVAWCSMLAAGSAAAFILSVFASSLLVLALRPDVGTISPTTRQLTLFLAGAPNTLGLVLLLATLGVAGWIRSRKLGLATTLFSATAGLAGFYAFATF